MANEIERRFLVDIARLPKLAKGKLQVQGYFNSLPGSQPEIRVRVEENKAFLTLKTFITFTTRQEFEYEIPLKEGQSLLRMTSHQVRKMRHLLKLGSQNWIIDLFQDDNSPLAIAEIELKSEEEEFEKPLWATQEVTSDLRYTAISLAFQPFNNFDKP